MTQINPDLYDSDPFDMKKSKFYIKDNRPLIDKVKDFGQSLLFWKGRKKGIVYTRDVEWDDIRYIFFPDKENEGKLVRLSIKSAKSICHSCQHIVECAEWGIRKETHGIWGGLTDSDRRKIRKERRITLEEEQSA